MIKRKNNQLTERVAIFCGSIFLFGLFGLFVTDLIFPGILLLIWLVSIPILLVESGWMGVWIIAQGTLWLFGLAFLLIMDIIFPSILLLAGLSALLVAIFPPDKIDRNKFAWPFSALIEQPEKQKAKRHMPLPRAFEEDDELDDDDTYIIQSPGHYDRAARS